MLQIEMEHEHPTPKDFSFWERWELRTIYKLLEQGEKTGTNWQLVAKYADRLLKRLERSKGLKVQDIKDGKGAEILVDGVGRIGYDISEMSDAWKQGYFDCLMTMARVGEWAVGQCKKKGSTIQDKIYRWENIPGPDNPRPVPLQWEKDGSHTKPPPTYAEVEPLWEDASVWYLRILTTKGFNNRQRLDAALAYADWCGFTGLKDTSKDMYDWALDIAAGGLPAGCGEVVNMTTGVINQGQDQFVTENLLRATTALGVHHARNGEVKEALPIFLSVLRARKALPPEPGFARKTPRRQLTAEELANRQSTEVFSGYLTTIRSFFKDADLDFSKTGDERPFHTLKEACEEVGLMTYIGEILFASTSSEQEKEKGLSWTRDSVDAAEAVLWFMDEQASSSPSEGRRRCQECLQTGLNNWQQMVQQMSRLALNKQQEAGSHKTGWFSRAESQTEKVVNEVQKWKDEEAQIELRRQKTSSLLNNLRSNDGIFAMV